MLVQWNSTIQIMAIMHIILIINKHNLPDISKTTKRAKKTSFSTLNVARIHHHPHSSTLFNKQTKLSVIHQYEQRKQLIDRLKDKRTIDFGGRLDLNLARTTPLLPCGRVTFPQMQR